MFTTKLLKPGKLFKFSYQLLENGNPVQNIFGKNITIDCNEDSDTAILLMRSLNGL